MPLQGGYWGNKQINGKQLFCTCVSTFYCLVALMFSIEQVQQVVYNITHFTPPWTNNSTLPTHRLITTHNNIILLYYSSPSFYTQNAMALLYGKQQATRVTKSKKVWHDKAMIFDYITPPDPFKRLVKLVLTSYTPFLSERQVNL